MSAAIPATRTVFNTKKYFEGSEVIDDTFFDKKVGAPQAVCPEGGLLVKVETLSCDPSQKFWVTEKADPAFYRPVIPLGQPMEALGIGTIVESKLDGFAVGDRVSSVLQWSDYSPVAPHFLGWTQKVDKALDFATLNSVVGMTGLTAWVAVMTLGEVKKGDTVLMSSAAGATGTAAVQLIKAVGATVIGLTSNDEKAKMLRDELKADFTINYKTEDLNAKLAEFAPKGLTHYIDLVGGDTLNTALKHVQRKGKVIVLGQMALYKDGAPVPVDLMTMLLKSISMHGMLVNDFAHDFPRAIETMLGYVKAGTMKAVVDQSQKGLDNVPKALAMLFKGENKGKLFVEL